MFMLPHLISSWIASVSLAIFIIIGSVEMLFFRTGIIDVAFIINHILDPDGTMDPDLMIVINNVIRIVFYLLFFPGG